MNTRHQKFVELVEKKIGREPIEDLHDVMKQDSSIGPVSSAFTTEELIEKTGYTKELVDAAFAVVAIEHTVVQGRIEYANGRLMSVYSLQERLPSPERNGTGYGKWYVLRI